MMQPFSLDVPLVPGPMVVEASAGTGKTFSIARLVARLIAEDPPEGGEPPTIDQVLVVTFTRAATAELRERVRAQLQEAAAGLQALRTQWQETGAVAVPADVALAHMASAAGLRPFVLASPDVLAVRAGRLLRAVQDFDTAAVMTIHGFCQRVLQQLAFESQSGFAETLVQDTTDLVAHIVDDWMTTHMLHATDAQYAFLTGPAKLNAKRLRNVARAVVGTRDAHVVPTPTGADWRTLADGWQFQARGLGARLAGPEGEALYALLTAWSASGALNQNGWKLAQIEAKFAAARAILPGSPTSAETAIALSAPVIRKALLAAHKAKADLLPPLAHDLGGLPPVADVHAPLAEFAAYVQGEFRARLTQGRQITYDDLLERVSSGVDHPALTQAIRQQFRVALIDEFQDTDGVQWKIFERVFLADKTQRLVLIGDPKQAIYGFRSADVRVYAAARDDARVPGRAKFTMDTNFRTDDPLVQWLNGVGAARPNVFLTDQIQFERVRAKHPVRLTRADGTPTPLVTWRWFDAALMGGDAGERPSNADAAAHLPALVAADIARELNGETWVQRAHERTPLRPRDVAVLVQSNRQARDVHAALARHGVPAILTQAGSVFESEEAELLQLWLATLAEDQRAGTARALAVSALFGVAAGVIAQVVQGSDPLVAAQWLQFLAQLRDHGETLASQGPAAAVAQLLQTPSPFTLPGDHAASPLVRLAQLPDGERRLTNVRHLGELMQQVHMRDRLGVRGLAHWLQSERADAATSGDAESAALRLESDADTVRVMTMHKSKGLEFPVVYLPFLHDGRAFRDTNAHPPLRYHQPDRLQVTLDVRGVGLAPTEDQQRAHVELLEDRQRLLYVALTRAAHRLVVYAGPTQGKAAFKEGRKQSWEYSPLGLLVHGNAAADEPEQDDPSRLARVDAVAKAATKTADGARLRTLAKAWLTASSRDHAGTVEWLDADTGHTTVRDPGAEQREPLVQPTPFARHDVTTLWRLESYSGLIGARHGQIVPEAPDTDARHDDEADDAVRMPDDEDPWTPMPTEPILLQDIPNPPDLVPADAPEIALRKFPGGKETGTWVHAVLEDLTFSPSLTPRASRLTLPELVRKHALRNGFATDRFDAPLVDALPRILATPLGGPLGELTLGDVTDAQRLNELKFDLPIGSGLGTRHEVPVSAAALSHLLGTPRPDRATAPYPAGYLEAVRQLSYRPLSGFLTGTMDLVFCVGAGASRRWFVADYKTNTLGPRPDDGGRIARSCLGHYSQAWMAAEMARKHYYVQSLLYLVALHRYLTWQVADYDYDTHMGGALYLFVRGMEGPTTPREGDARHGCFFDKPPKSLIVALSDLLARTAEVTR